MSLSNKLNHSRNCTTEIQSLDKFHCTMNTDQCKVIIYLPEKGNESREIKGIRHSLLLVSELNVKNCTF